MQPRGTPAAPDRAHNKYTQIGVPKFQASGCSSQTLPSAKITVTKQFLNMAHSSFIQKSGRK